jgi:hypothetical protein
VSVPEGRRVLPQLSAIELARLVTNEDISNLINEASSSQGIFARFVQDKIHAVKDTFADALSGIEQELDRTVAVNPHHEELWAAAGGDEDLLEAVNLSINLSLADDGGGDTQPDHIGRAQAASRDHRSRWRRIYDLWPFLTLCS